MNSFLISLLALLFLLDFESKAATKCAMDPDSESILMTMTQKQLVDIVLPAALRHPAVLEVVNATAEDTYRTRKILALLAESGGPNLRKPWAHNFGPNLVEAMCKRNHEIAVGPAMVYKLNPNETIGDAANYRPLNVGLEFLSARAELKKIIEDKEDDVDSWTREVLIEFCCRQGF